MKVDATISLGSVLWLEEAIASESTSACSPLAGRTTADVCVVGGGFAGLWTAIELRERSPETSVALLERESCGFGASGRNGGWATSWFKELGHLARRFGDTEALRLAERSSAAIDRLDSFSPSTPSTPVSGVGGHSRSPRGRAN